jgi:phosphoribosylformimino-5-aminoimidazole carboxamide ribotide isomerase
VEEVREAEEIGEIVIIGTETGTLDVIRKTQSMRIAVSVDIRNDNVISPDPELVGNPLEVIEKLNRYKMNEMILLNINTVGTKSGVNLAAIREVLDVTGHRLIVTGGIQSLKEVDALEDLGVGGVILSTAIHEELIPVDVVR